VAELVYARDSKSRGSNPLRVRVSPKAQYFQKRKAKRAWQNRVVARPCGFESHLGHTKNKTLAVLFLYFRVRLNFSTKHQGYQKNNHRKNHYRNRQPTEYPYPSRMGFCSHYFFIISQKHQKNQKRQGYQSVYEG
jgi:hypothetical protein